MLQSQGYDAFIRVENQEVQQYGVEISPDGKKVTCWIASEAGKSFSVHWRNSLPYRPAAISAHVKVDGLPCGGSFVANGLGNVDGCISGIVASMMTTRPFTFSPLELTDDDNLLRDPASLQHLGEIELAIRRVEFENWVVPKPFVVPEEQKVHERSKKAMVHRVKFGEECKTETKRTCKVRNLDHDPVVTFVFKYRSLDQLRANGIAPTHAGEKRRATTDLEKEEVNHGQSSGNHDSDDEELKVLQNRINAIKAAKKAKRVKMEPRNESTISYPGEIVDLT